jgi:hypothetical protein
VLLKPFLQCRCRQKVRARAAARVRPAGAAPAARVTVVRSTSQVCSACIACMFFIICCSTSAISLAGARWRCPGGT